MSREKLTGDCNKCKYADLCLGGCANTRLSMNGNIYSENLYCSHNFLMKKFREKLKKVYGTKDLTIHADKMLNQKKYQEASMTLERLLELEPNKTDIINKKTYADKMCNNLYIHNC